MKKQNLTIKTIFSLTAVLGVVVLLNGCSDDKPKTVAKKSAHAAFDHTHGMEVTDLVKHKFEHDFAEQCVAREIKDSINKDVDKKRYTKPCLCIATFMMKDLTAVEAEKFLQEHKNTQSLRIRYENAAYHCLQEKARPKAAKLFGKR